MTPIFPSSVFEYVNAPVPSGYLYGQTHTSIQFVPSAFLGYTHWLAASPYPNQDVAKENPCVYFANVRGDGRPPIEFTPHGANPLQDTPVANAYNANPFNSDPDIFLDTDTNKMYLLNRPVGVLDEKASGIAVNEINCQEITSTTTATTKTVLFTRLETSNCVELLSPALSKVGGKFRIQFLESTGGSVNVKCKGLVTMESTTMDRNFVNQRRGSIYSKSPIEAWHWDSFVHGAKTYAVVCATDWNDTAPSKPLRLYLAESSNGYDFSIYEKPLISNYSYRGSAYVRPSDGLFVLYATLTDPDLKVYSVDGREIVLCTKNFTELLNELRI